MAGLIICIIMVSIMILFWINTFDYNPLRDSELMTGRWYNIVINWFGYIFIHLLSLVITIASFWGLVICFIRIINEPY